MSEAAAIGAGSIDNAYEELRLEAGVANLDGPAATAAGEEKYLVALL